MALLQQYNFIRFDDGIPSASIESDLPNGYRRDRNACDYKPLLVASEAMRFYINSIDGLTFIPGGADPHLLALVKANGTLQNANIAPLQQHAFTNPAGAPAKTYYAEVLIDGTIPQGDYYFAIKDGSTIRATSNLFTVLPTTSDYKNYSVLAKFRHDRYFYGFNYGSLDTFYQQFRLHLNEIDNNYEGDKEVYTAVTTGKQRTYNNYMKQLKKVEAYYFDAYAHEAAAVMFDSDEVYLNLKRYQSKSPYKTSYAILSKSYKGEIDLYVEEFATANRCNS